MTMHPTHAPTDTNLTPLDSGLPVLPGGKNRTDSAKESTVPRESVRPQHATDHRFDPTSRAYSPGDVGKDSQISPPATTIKKCGDPRLDNARLMLKKDHPNVLPLHLTPIDSYFLADDQPRYPMTSIIRLKFSGRMHAKAFDTALFAAIERHPLIGAVVRPAKRGMLCWVKDSQLRPWVDWGPIDRPIQFPTEESIDLSKECGLRFWIRVDETQTVMTMQVHHACTDGTGVYRFLGDLLALYGQQTRASQDEMPELAEIDPRQLRHRRTRFSELFASVKTSEFLKNGVSQTWDIFGRRIVPLAIPSGTSTDGKIKSPFPGVTSYQFSKDEHKKLRAVAAEYGAMLNDLLLAEMFRTILRWNQMHGKHQAGLLRLMMPSDLREQQDYPMPATNMTAYTFITRHSSACQEMRELMKGIREETSRIKHEQLGKRFMDTLQFADYAPSILKFLLRRKRCITTVILSNVGDPSRRFTASLPRQSGRIVSGNLVLEDVSGVPPLRAQSHATLAVFSYQRKLTISVRCDPYQFSPQDSQKFMQMYADGLRAHIA